MSTLAQAKGPALYESSVMLNKYLHMHWANESELNDEAMVKQVALPDVVHLPLKCAQIVLEYTQGKDKALDLGCAVGRSTFELARDFKEVVGIDYSHEFIDAARALQRDGELAYEYLLSGNDTQATKAIVDAAIERARVSFVQGDACALPSELQDFDTVLLANVLCRLPEPLKCLQRLPSLLKKGGVLVMTTPLSWLEDYTPPAHWLKGLNDVAKALPDFELLHTQELPFMIREHRRKYEYIITQASVWRLK
jgi:putative 4-mercaptohistidine N1-methyltranferase